MRRRLIISYLALVAVALVLFTVPVAISSSNLLRTNLQQTALLEARLFTPLVQRSDPGAATAIADRTRDFQQATGARVRLISTQQSAPEQTDTEQTDTDPQVRQALTGSTPPAVWGYSSLLGAEGVSVVLPVRASAADPESPVVAVVQVVSPSAAVDAQVTDIWIFRSGIGAAVLAASALIGLVLARSLVKPLQRLEAVARQLGKGDWSARAPETGPEEIASLARTLNASAATTGSLLASQRAFVADASHQLRTPLTSIRLSLDNVVDATDDPAQTRQLNRIEGEVERMSRMVDGLLALARADSPAAAVEPVDVAEVVAERRDVWLPALRTKDIRWIHRGPESAVASLTPGSLEQVVDNLVDNAVAASPSGGAVTVSVSRTDEHVTVTIDDQGPGMTPEQRTRAFDRFWRAGAPGTGSGLGLAIVRNLVERDGGQVDLGSSPDGGLSVRVAFAAVN